LNIPEGAFVWAMAGWRAPNKKPARVAELARHHTRQGFDARLLWIGGAENGYSQFVRGKAEALGVADRVTWLGARTADYYHCLNAADGLVLTSSRESFSIVSAEAAYLGKPVVAFDCGGVREIVAEGMGEIVKSWDPSDLARAMAGVMSGATRFDPQVARERVKEFDVAVQVRRWERIMRKYFGGAPAPRAS
jgi:glycosyltransferase involved in cell wall biosynthesis